MEDNTTTSVFAIPVDDITPSPFQHRKVFDTAKLNELAENIRQHGLIQPVVVRPLGKSRYELVCGERRWRATKQIGSEDVLAIVRNMDDKQARVACLSENVQRADLTPIERIEAVAEWVDAYLDQNCEDYRDFLKQQLSKKVTGRVFLIDKKKPDITKPLHRCAFILALMESDRRHGTDLANNFVGKIQEAFEVLRSGTEPTSFAMHDLPLLVKLESHQKIKEAAAAKGLNKSQTEALVEVAEEVGEERATELISDGFLGTPIEDCSAREISLNAGFDADRGRNAMVKHFTGDNESYTPAEYVDAAREVLGTIDLDPASNDKAQRIVKATTYYTITDNGLLKDWAGNVFINPPYSNPEIEQFIDKLILHTENGTVPQAILLTNDNTDSGWFHKAAGHASALCLLRGRINFYKRDDSTTSPTNGQTFFYFGPNKEAFAEVFSKFGHIAAVFRHECIA